MLPWSKESRAAAKAKREAEDARFRANYEMRRAADLQATATRQATNTIAAQIASHPQNVTALNVTVRDGTVSTPAGTWPIHGTSAEVAAHSTRISGARVAALGLVGGAILKEHSALLVIVGPDGEIYERTLDRAADIRAAQMLVAHITALAAARRPAEARSKELEPRSADP
jgi:hypothetical protein